MAEIHADFRKNLARETATVAISASTTPIPTDADLEDDEAILFGAKKPAKRNLSPPKGFDMDSVFQGQEALEKLRTALAEERPYALAFIDVRMPPGGTGSRRSSSYGAQTPYYRSCSALPIPTAPGKRSLSASMCGIACSF
jgi:hypothetical protein